MVRVSARSAVLADLSLLAAATAWGVTFPLGKMILGEVGPFTYLALRFAVASAVLLPAALPGLRRIGRRAWAGLGVGVVLFSVYALQTVGLQFTSASSAALITGMYVPMVPLLSIMWLRRAPSAITTAGVVVATAGLALLTFRPGLALRTGDLLVLLCAVGIALQVQLVGAMAEAMPPLVFALLQIAPVAILSGAMAMATESPHAPPPWTWAAVAGLAVIATALPFVFQSWAQRYVSPTRAGLLMGFEPAAGVLLAAAILGERLRGGEAVGSALILAGIAIVEFGRRGPQGGRAEG